MPDSPSPTTSGSLFTLPAEIRNKIYRYTLTSPSKIAVTAHGLREPALLSTCRPIRTEAASIFYYENTFAIDNNNYNSDALRRWAKKSRQISTQLLSSGRPAAVRSCRSERPNWPNLERWLKCVYYRSVLSVDKYPRLRPLSACRGTSQPNRKKQAALVSLLFKRVLKLRERSTAWVEVVKARKLQALRVALKHLD